MKDQLGGITEEKRKITNKNVLKSIKMYKANKKV